MNKFNGAHADRWFATAVGIWAVTIGCHSSDQASILAAAIEATVVLETYDAADRRLGQGSGFFLSSGQIVTNHHVIAGARRAEVTLHDGSTLEIRAVASEDVAADLVLLIVDGAPVTGGDLFARWQRENRPVREGLGIRDTQRTVEPGTRVFVVGSPLGLARSVTDGVISAVRTINRIEGVLQFTAPVSPGSSGSPVLDEEGHLFGIVTSQISQGQNLNFAVPASRIAQMDPFPNPLALDEWNRVTAGNTVALAETVEADSPAYAKGLYELAVRADPQSWRGWAGLGRTTVELYDDRDLITGRHDERTFFVRAVQLNPNYVEGFRRVDFSYVRAAAGGQETDPNATLSRLTYGRTAVDHNPGSAVAWGVFARSLENAGDVTGAVDAYRQALSIDPSYHELRADLAGAYAYLGNRIAAREQVEILWSVGFDRLAQWLEQFCSLCRP